MGGAVATQVPVTGSYNSALERVPLQLNPPAINTFPLGNIVAVCSPRLDVRSPVTGAKVVVAGSKSSEFEKVLEQTPAAPTTRTFPVGKRVAVGPR